MESQLTHNINKKTFLTQVNIQRIMELDSCVTNGHQFLRKDKKNLSTIPGDGVVACYRLNILNRLIFCRQARYGMVQDFFFHSNRNYEHTVPVQLGIFPTKNFLQSCKLTLGGDIASTYPGCCIILGM